MKFKISNKLYKIDFEIDPENPSLSNWNQYLIKMLYDCHNGNMLSIQKQYAEFTQALINSHKILSWPKHLHFKLICKGYFILSSDPSGQEINLRDEEYNFLWFLEKAAYPEYLPLVTKSNLDTLLSTLKNEKTEEDALITLGSRILRFQSTHTSCKDLGITFLKCKKL